MELREMFEMQKGLDQHIERNHGLENEDLVDRKVLALLVELGELANETRVFKFWSLKPASAQSVILEEFVDGIHFILSLGLECRFDSMEEIIVVDGTSGMTEQFLIVYEAVHKFRRERTLENYQLLFQSYLFLANLLGFKDDEIKRAYISKNEVNYKRQQEGY